MERHEELQAKARELERGGKPREALDVYLRLAAQEERADGGSLWAHIGDLQLRLDDSAAASGSFARSMELFRAAGQANNAIALCLRMIESNPDDPAAHQALLDLTLERRYRAFAGQAAARLAHEAATAGRPQAALGPLTAFLDRFPDDADVWREWADEMLGLGEESDAVAVLVSIAEHLDEIDAPESADRVRQEIRRIDPSAVPAAISVQEDRPPPIAEAGQDLQVSPLPGLEPTHAGAADEVEDELERSAAEPLPLLDSTGAPPGLDTKVPPLSPDEVEDEARVEEDFEPLPLLDTSMAGEELGADEDADDEVTGVDLDSLILEPTALGGEAEGAPSAEAGAAELDLPALVAELRQLSSRDVEPSDAATHYDLALAFKEMGLIEESLAHLAAALEGGHQPLPVLEVLGEVLVERGEHALAARILRMALGSDESLHPDLAGVHYWLGRSQEALGDQAAAHLHFERVVQADPSFRDAAQRLDNSPLDRF